MFEHRRRRAIAGAAAVSGTVAAAVAAVALERHHLRRIQRDPDYARLGAPLGGRRLEVRSADGTRLHAEAFGPQDGPTIVLAHGWTEQLSFWGPVIRLLAERGLRPVAFDLRGHGESGAAAGRDYALERFGEDLEAVLAAATPAGKRATVAGHSLGAMSIAAWAEHHDVAARANAAAMISTGLGDLITGHLLYGELAKRLGSRIPARLSLGSRAPLPAFSSPLQHAVIRYATFGPTATFGEIAFYERMLMACPTAVRAATGIALSDMDLWQAVTRLTVPTLVIVGAEDRLTPPAHAERIVRTLPQPEGLVELPQTGHMAPLERPEAVSEALAKLIVGVTPVAATAGA